MWLLTLSHLTYSLFSGVSDVAHVKVDVRDGPGRDPGGTPAGGSWGAGPQREQPRER